MEDEVLPKQGESKLVQYLQVCALVFMICMDHFLARPPCDYSHMLL